MDSKIYTTTVQDAGDGSGDCIVELPLEIIQSMGLKEGDIFNIDIVDNAILLTKVEN